jgi:Toastrack DUF4097
MRAPRAGRRAASSIHRGRPAGALAPAHRRGWNAAVAVSAGIFVLVALTTGVGWLASKHSRVTTYSAGRPTRQVSLQLSSGNVVIVGSGSSTIIVRRTDSYSFGHPARERRSYARGALTVSSSCPRILVGTCSASYEVAAPETVAVKVQTADGSVRLDGFRGSASVQTDSGSVDAEAYCGFDLSASSASGDLHVAAACAPQQLQLHTGSGDAVALVPPGRYRLATSGAQRRITGITRDPTAPFSLDVHSGSGAVTIGGGL